MAILANKTTYYPEAARLRKNYLWTGTSPGFSQAEAPDRQSVRGLSYTLVCTLKDRVQTKRLTLQAIRMYRLSLREQFSIFFIYSIRKHSVPVNIPHTIFYALRLSPFTIKC